jgi:Ca2+-binding RTX toxin-like protein
MARLLTAGPVDLLAVDWAAIRTGALITLETGVNDTVRGLVYRDVLVIDGPGGPLWLWGEGLVADPQGRLVGGTVQAIAQGGTRFEPDWMVQQISLPAATVSAAVWSAGTTDDRAVLMTALAGDDLLRVDQDFDNRAFGGMGQDTIYGGRGNDTLFGDNGHDLIESFFGNDLVFGGWGNDTIRASADNDTAYGGAGDDVIGATSGVNRFWGGDGRDSLTGGSGTDTLRGDAGADTLQGWAGDDLAAGGDGDDLAFGGTGADRLFGDAGNDTLSGDDDNDRLFGGQGDDQLFGGRHADRLEGGAGRDTLEGGDGDDSLLGGSEADVLRGGNGSDTLAGGTGRDTLEGGTGTDVFVFVPGHGTDTITDFTAGAIIFNDRLQLAATLWAGEGALDAAGVVARFATVGADGFVRLTFAGAGTTIILQGVTDAAVLVPQIDIL